MINITPIEQKKLTEILSENGVEKAFLFGSVVTDRFQTSTSDLDILIILNECNPLKKGVLLLGIWDELESALKRKVDLITPDSIKNPLLKEVIDQTKVLFYDREGVEMDA
jgi:predicted nucleotidyltransferase